MRPRRIWLTAWCTAIILAWPPAAADNRDLQRASVFERYLQLLQSYGREPTTAAAAISGWTDRDVRDGAEACLKLWAVRPKNLPDIPTAFAAVMLHTDAAIEAGLNDRNTTAALHLRLATAVMDLVIREEKAEHQLPFRPGAWHLAVLRALTALFEWDVDESVLRAGRSDDQVAARIRELADLAERDRAGSGAQLLLAVASLQDGSAHMGLRVRQVSQRGQRTWATPGEAELRRWMTQAAGFYREALERAPGLVEARLRLGHLLFESGRAVEARDELGQVLAAARESRQVYLACLFLGRMHDDENETDRALTFYERALAAWPASQTARIALASVHERSGDIESARRSILPLLDRPAAPPDPWGVYFMGQSEEGFRALDEMRAAVIALSTKH